MAEGIAPLSRVMNIVLGPTDSLNQRWGSKIANLSQLIAAIGPITPSGIAIDRYETGKVITSLRQVKNEILKNAAWQDFVEQIIDLMDRESVYFPAILRSSLVDEGKYLSSWSGIADSKAIYAISELSSAILGIAASLSTNLCRDYQSQIQGHSPQNIDNNLALLLQTYFPSRWAGVALTDGRGTSKGEFVIDISDKHNNDVTAGRMPSFQVSLSKSNGSLIFLNGNLSMEDIFTETTISNIFELGLEIESFFEQPQCIEWAADKDGHLMIFQAYPYKE